MADPHGVGILGGVPGAETSAKPIRKRKAPPHAFKPGRSGNPKGMGVVPPEERARRAELRREARRIELQKMSIEELAREHAPRAIAVLRDILTRSKSDKSRAEAAMQILDRGFGKPAQAVALASVDYTPADPAVAERARLALDRLRSYFGGMGQKLIESREPATVVQEGAPGENAIG